MPRRRLGGAALGILFAVFVTSGSVAAEEIVIPDQDLSRLSREGQTAYLILKDQLLDIHIWIRKVSQAAADSTALPRIACVRGGPSGSSGDRLPLLLDLLNHADVAKFSGIRVVPAAACEVGAATIRFREPGSLRSATLIEIRAVSADQPASRWGAGWTEAIICGGLCGQGSSCYELGEHGDSMWLTRTPCDLDG